ncbi:MAG: tRNA dihydrouridine synthase DusB [Thermodesulfobacteriota bacterium]
MRIGDIRLENPFILGPMAGVTDVAFRLMARRMGAALVCSEMVSAMGLVQESARTRSYLVSDPAEKPFCVQIFGSRPGIMAEAAAMVQHSGADMMDINFGCSVPKIVKNGCGVALMQNPELCREIIGAVRKAVSIPLSVKMRSGWDASGDQAMTLSRIAEDCGADMVTVHPRTARQGFSGRADWSVITRVKQALSIPVAGNGDVCCAQDAAELFSQTGCDLVMIARAARANPWIFSQAKARMAGEAYPEPDLEMRHAALFAYIDDAERLLPPRKAVPELRGRLAWLTRSMPGAAKLRVELTRIESFDHARGILSGYFHGLLSPEPGPEEGQAPNIMGLN